MSTQPEGQEGILNNPETQMPNRDPRVESLAVPIARDYAEKNYPMLEDGTFVPAWRGVNGEKVYKGKSPQEVAAVLVTKGGYTEEAAVAVAETMVIDIANTSYDKYSEYWKEQNRGGAEFLIALMDTETPGALLGLDLTDASVRSKYGKLIHDSWLDRMGGAEEVAKWSSDQAVEFDDLSTTEQQKDIDQLAVLQRWISQNSAELGL